MKLETPVALGSEPEAMAYGTGKQPPYTILKKPTGAFRAVTGL